MVRPYFLKAFIVIMLTSLLFFYEFALGNIYNSLGHYLAGEFKLNSVELGLLASLYFYTDLIFLTPAGVVMDRYSPRLVISIVLLISSSGVLLTAFAHQTTLLILSRLLMGFGGGFCFVGCIRIAVNWFPAKYMARISGFIVTMGMLGGFMVQTPLTLIINEFGWRKAIVIVTVIGYSIAMLIYLFVRDVPQERQEEIAQRVSMHVQHGTLKCLRLSLLNKQNWLCGLYTSLMNLPIFMLGALWGIPYLTQVNHLSVAAAATISGMLYLGSMLGAPSLGLISDQLGRRKLPMQVGSILAIILIFTIMHISAANFWLLLILFLLLGFITSSQIISYPTVVESNSKMVSSSATSVISMMCMGGGMLIEPLFGYLLAYKGGATELNTTIAYPTQNYQFAMYALPIAFLLALVATFFIKETYAKSLSDT